MRLNNLQSFLFWFGSVFVMSLVGFGVEALVIDHTKSFDFVGWAWFSILMGTMFGTMYWGVMTMPTKIRENKGWMRFRPLLWILGIASGLLVLFACRHPIDFSYVGPCLFMGAYVTVAGWGIGYLRCERAKKLFGEPDSV